MKKEYNAVPQTGNVFKDGKLIGCNQAQIFFNGKSFLVIEPTDDEKEATDTAIFLAEALNDRIK